MLISRTEPILGRTRGIVSGLNLQVLVERGRSRLTLSTAGSGRGGWTGYFLNFTSQQWLTPELVSRSVWWHTLVVIVPDNLTTMDTTIMWMTGKFRSMTSELRQNNFQTVTTTMTSRRISPTTTCWLPERLPLPMALWHQLFSR